MKSAHRGSAIDSSAFRLTVSQFATGVTVIATDVDGAVHAMTANSFTALSLHPPLVLFCAGKTSKMGQIIDKATGFCINILRQEQEALSTYFAGGWRESTLPLFSFLPWEGGPRLEGSAASIGCVIDGVHEGGDHWIVVGRVVALRASHGSAPLVFFGGRYATIMATSEAQVLVSGF